VKMWPKMEEIFDSVVKHKKTVVWSCNGVSKTESSAILNVLWVLAFFPAYAVVTSSSWDTALQTLLPRIRSRANQARRFFPMLTEPTITEWWPFGKQYEHAVVCCSPKERENIAGRHNKHVFANVDEGSHLTRDIMGGIDGITVRPMDRILMPGNPLLNSGVMYEAGSIHRLSDENPRGWNLIQISAMDSPNYKAGYSVPGLENLVGRMWVEEKMEEWKNNPEELYPRVFGMPPPDTELTVISAAALIRSNEMVPKPDAGDVVLSVDPTWGGLDKAVFVVRNDSRMIYAEERGGMKEPAILERMLELRQEYPEIVRGIVDSTGNPSVGHFLEDQGHDWVEILIYAQAANDSKRFKNTRAEFYFEFRDQLDRGFHIPDAYLKKLVSQAGIQRLPGVPLQIEAKDKIRERIGCSPDMLDALAQSFYKKRGAKVFDTASTAHKMVSQPKVWRDEEGQGWLVNTKNAPPEFARRGTLARIFVVKENDESAVVWFHKDEKGRVTVYRGMKSADSTPRFLAEVAEASRGERYAADFLTAKQGINVLWRVQEALEATAKGSERVEVPDFIPYAKIDGTEGVDYLDRLHIGTLSRKPDHPYWRGDTEACKIYARRPEFILYWPDDVLSSVRDARFLEPMGMNETERQERIVKGGGAYVLAMRLFAVVESGAV